MEKRITGGGIGGKGKNETITGALRTFQGTGK
jgi:hypothetical protein